MAKVEYFLQLDRIPGNSKNPRRPGWIPVVTFERSGIGDPRGPDIVDIVAAAGDPAYAALFEYARSGKHVKKGQLDMYRSGSFRTVLTIQDALVSTQLNFTTSASDSNNRDRGPVLMMRLLLYEYKWLA